MVSNRSAPPGPVIPVLVYEDVAHAIGWLCDTFGFREHFHYGRDGQVEGAALYVGEGSVMLTTARAADGTTEYRPPRPGELSQSVMVRVEDIDAHYGRAKERGAQVLLEPQTYPFGERQYSAVDFAGHRWSFTQSVADAAPEDWGGITPEDV